MEVKVIVEERMLQDDETTAHQIYHLLKEKGINISIWTIFRCRKDLGWTFRGSAYCQLIRNANKEKRLQWAKENIDEAEDGFDNVIFTDERQSSLNLISGTVIARRDANQKTNHGTYVTSHS